MKIIKTSQYGSFLGPDPEEGTVYETFFVQEDEDVQFMASLGIPAELGKERQVRIEYRIEYEEGIIRGDQGSGVYNGEITMMEIYDDATGIRMTEDIKKYQPDYISEWKHEVWKDAGRQSEKGYRQEDFVEPFDQDNRI